MWGLLTLLGSWGTGGDFLIGIDGGFWGEAVELLAADEVNLLEILHLLLRRSKRTKIHQLQDIERAADKHSGIVN